MIVDFEKLGALGRTSTPDAFNEVLGILAEELKDMYERLNRAVANDDENGVLKTVHKIAGCAAQFYLDELRLSTKVAMRHNQTISTTDARRIMEDLLSARRAIEVVFPLLRVDSAKPKVD